MTTRLLSNGDKEQSKISFLAETVAKNTATYEAYLKDNGLALPSHEANAPQPPQSDVPLHIAEARDAAIEASQELSILLLGPAQNMLQNSCEQFLSVCLRIICRHDIARRVPLDGTIAVTDLAEQCGLDANDLIRVLRCAEAWHVFTEPKKGQIAHTASSKLLKEDDVLKAWLDINVEWIQPFVLSIADAMDKWPGSQNPLQTAWCLAHGQDVDGFSFWYKDPKITSTFAKGMSYMSLAPGFQPSIITDQFDFSQLPKRAKWIDIGGGIGVAACAVARANPGFTVIVQELPSFLAGMAADVIPENLRNQVTFMEHDMFTDQPVTDGDVYFSRGVLHDWSDEDAVKILRRLVPALAKGNKVIAAEMVLPDPGDGNMLDLRRMRSLDVQLKGWANAKERSADQWIDLFREADSRFGTPEVLFPRAGEKVGLIVATWTA